MPALNQTDFDLQITANKNVHNTNHYSSKELVLRRGQAFRVGLKKALQCGETIELSAETVSIPKTKFPFSKSASEVSWSALEEQGASNTILFTICSPPTARIGRYSLSAQISSGGTSTTIDLGHFVLLFNPWCAGDDVYMPIEAEREEYVLTDSGIVYRGSQDSIQPNGWAFGQFADEILDISLTILDKSIDYCKSPSTDCEQRNNPIHVSRVISEMVNCQDDEGVLEGNWSGHYEGGTSPGNWHGSVDILHQWKKSGYKSVKYGQCWVFSAVTCTVLRCLGIPARPVTNFSSAHDTDGNLTIDEYYDEHGKSMNISKDSVWNFHVWDEGWFARKDLGEFYNGWQVLDATPQERSQGIYCCGPTSVKAVKEGDVGLNYDSPFVFAELNADRVSWVWHSETNKEKLRTDTCSVGQKISTKAVGSNERADITDNYKYREGSPKEREVFTKAHNKMLGKEPAAPEISGGEKVSGEFKISQTILFGEDMNLILILKNPHVEKAKSVKMSISVASIMYTGRSMSHILHQKSSITLGPKEEKEIPFKVSYLKYKHHLSRGEHHIKIVAVCLAEGEGKFLVQKIITLESPPIQVKVLDQAIVRRPCKAVVIFTNPLSKELTDCTLLVVGSTLSREHLEIKVNPIKPKETVTIPFVFMPIAKGKKQLSVNFNCDKFHNVKTFEEVNVASHFHRFKRH